MDAVVVVQEGQFVFRGFDEAAGAWVRRYCTRRVGAEPWQTRVCLKKSRPPTGENKTRKVAMIPGANQRGRGVKTLEVNRVATLPRK